MVSKNLNQTEVAEATRLDQDAVRFHAETIVSSLDGLEVDHLGALAVRLVFCFSSWDGRDTSSSSSSAACELNSQI